MDVVKKASEKKQLKEHYDKLEELRSTLLATKHKSIFADEKKLRENITEVYGAICGQECKPTNLQLGRITVLNDDLDKGKKTYDKLVADYGIKTTEIINTEKSRPKTNPSNAGN